MEKRYQVFVSSTYSDLVEERREVMQALLELDCIPAGMELFPAADDDAWTLIARVIDDSDYYVLIVGGRYGSISVDGISFTEREYDYAIERGIPVLAFIHGSPELIVTGKAEMSLDAQVKLGVFRRKVRQKIVKTYQSAQELGSVVSRSLVRAIKERPGEGWVRGRNAATPELAAEMSDLRARLAEAELAAKGDAARLSSAIGSDVVGLAQGDDEIRLAYRIVDVLGHQIETIVRSRAYTWNQLLSILGPMLFNEASEVDMKEAIEHDIADSLGGLGHRDGYEAVRITPTAFNQVKIQLRALHLIVKGIKKREVGDRRNYWLLTDRGDKEVIAIMAMRRNVASPHGQATEVTA